VVGAIHPPSKEFRRTRTLSHHFSCLTTKAKVKKFRAKKSTQDTAKLECGEQGQVADRVLMRFRLSIRAFFGRRKGLNP
jgi:hypothetical protein